MFDRLGRVDRSGLAAVAAAVAVAVAFADSSIVVLALPELYAQFDTSIIGVSWVITSYNLVVAVAAFVLLAVVRRVRPAPLALAGLSVFLAASIACSASGSLGSLVAFRCAQGLGAALLLAASLPVLVALTGSVETGRHWWVLAGALGAACGPALGGLLTELFDWRAIFVAQAPIGGLALLAVLTPAVRALPAERERPAFGTAWRANLGLLFLFGALVGALFLAVLMMVTVWDLGPLAGGAVVSVLPLAALLARPLASALGSTLDRIAGGLLLAAGLVALALLPKASSVYAALALVVCGAGFGLAVPSLTGDSVRGDTALAGRGTISIGFRHLGLVLALAAIAPVLAGTLDGAARRATVNATATILDSPISLTKKVPIALDLSKEIGKAADGEIPDLAAPFDEHGAGDDEDVRRTRDDLLATVQETVTRSFRSSYLVAAGFALLSLLPVGLGRLRRPRA